MTFRDDLDAASAHIASLEKEVQDLRARTGIERLEARCHVMERTIASCRISTLEARLACWLTPALGILCWVIGFMAVTRSAGFLFSIFPPDRPGAGMTMEGLR